MWSSTYLWLRYSQGLINIRMLLTRFLCYKHFWRVVTREIFRQTMSSATYLLTETNGTMYGCEEILEFFDQGFSFSSWTYDRFLSNASIEKKDLSLLGFITGILSIISIVGSLMFRIILHLRGRMASKDSPADSPSASSVTTTTTNTTPSEF